jgi:hypothetical protein
MSNPQSPPRNGRGQFGTADPAIEAVRDLNDDGTARHLDDRRHAAQVITTDRRRDARATAHLALTDADIRDMDSIISIGRRVLARMMRARKMLEERQAEDAEYDRHLEAIAASQEASLRGHREGAQILEQVQRGRSRLHLRAERVEGLDVVAEEQS